MVSEGCHVSLANTDPLLGSILQIEKVCVQLLIIWVHRGDGESRGVDRSEREDQMRKAGGVNVRRPDLVARAAACVPDGC